jgi:hypothetical protein
MSDLEALVDSILKMSPPVALMVGLNSLMYYLRRTPHIPLWLVPWVIMILGAVTYPMITNSGDMIFTVPYPLVAQSIIGFIIGFAAIGVHRLFEQTMWRFGYDKNGGNGTSQHKATGEKFETDLKKRPTEKRDPPPDVGL